MITSIEPLDISLEQWLVYAFRAIPESIFTAAIIILVTFLVFYGVAIGWGLLWNKKWTIGRNNRWLMVFVLAAITAACLAARDSLCNGGLNSFLGEADKVPAAFTGGSIDEQDSDQKSAYEVAKRFTRLFPRKGASAGLGDDIGGSDPESGDASDSEESSGLPDDSEDGKIKYDGEIKYAVSESSGSNYKNCYRILTYVSLACLLLLLIVIPCVSYRDIRLIYPVPADDGK